MTSSQTPSPQTPAAEPILLTEIDGPLAHATLNRPRQLNALSLALVTELGRTLRTWADDESIELVLVTGAGERGLCAGGDIKELYGQVVAGVDPAPFFEREYAMNLLIAQYPKPYVVVMDGITMGGGVGISGHGSVRVVTERSVIAMPETGIGLFPDVGALYLLSRAPGELGTHLALTGGRLDGPSAIAAGLADRYLPSDRVDDLADTLRSGPAGLETFDWPEVPAAQPVPSWIDECYVGDSVEAIVTALRAHPDPEAQATAALLGTLSPTSLKVTLFGLRRAAHLDVAGVLEQDLHLTQGFRTVPDLVEGIRAQVIDKDRNPRWNPATLAEVDDTAVAALF